MRVHGRFKLAAYAVCVVQSPENNIAAIRNKYGATMLNLHQGTLYNPFISYPFTPNVTKRMTQLGVAARSAGLRGLKIYHEIHELSTRSSESELWALLSLGDEVLQKHLPLENWPGDGANLLGFQWLQEHLLQTTNKSNANYATAFYQRETDGNMDQSVRLQRTSRMNNWWIESIHYLATHAPWIDGLYLDGTAVDRWTMKRARKVLAQSSPVAHIDFHCANPQGNTYENAGNGSTALRYMTHFPYLSSLWFGEGFWYGQGWGVVPEPGQAWTPEEWLVEVSGLPFGLTGDLLGGSPYENPYQAFVFGMQGRMPQPMLYERDGIGQGAQPLPPRLRSPSSLCRGNSHCADCAAADPRPLFELIDRYDLAATEMCGWWHGDCAVQSQATAVKATVFTHGDPRRAIVVVANFGRVPVNASLLIDWGRLGLKVSSSIHAPAVYNFQPEHQFSCAGAGAGELVVPLGVGAPSAGRVPSPPAGWILVIE